MLTVLLSLYVILRFLQYLTCWQRHLSICAICCSYRHVKHSQSSTSLPLFSHICLPSVVPKFNSANTFCTNQTLTHSELFLRFQALVLMHRFFSFSLVIFFILWHSSTRESSSNLKVRKLLHNV